jgi:hypothetical protein
MPKLIRRRCPERPDSWHIHADVEVGTIARRSGAPFDVDQWEWQCGFYPGMELGAHRDGTGEPFEFCRVDFEKAWLEILSTLSGANFKEWRLRDKGTGVATAAPVRASLALRRTLAGTEYASMLA